MVYLQQAHKHQQDLLSLSLHNCPAEYAGKTPGRAHLPYIIASADIAQEDVLGHPAVVGIVAGPDVDAWVQDGHPSLPICMQPGHKGLHAHQAHSAVKRKPKQACLPAERMLSLVSAHERAPAHARH